MKAIESIQKVVNYIENNYNKEISVKELSDIGGLSLFYFQRLFKDSVGTTVEQYVKYRRLAHSCDMLKKGNLIQDASQKSGFRNSEHYSREFKKLYGISPSEYKKSKLTLNHLYKPDVILNNCKIDFNEKYISNEIVMEINVVNKDAVNVLGYEEICTNTIDKPGKSGASVAWEKFHSNKNKIGNRQKPFSEYGISHSFSRKGFRYLAGAAVSSLDGIDDNMSSFLLPEGKYIRCVYENESFEKATTVNMKNVMGYFSSWFRKNKYKSDGKPYAVEYYSENAFNPPYRIEILAKIL